MSSLVKSLKHRVRRAIQPLVERQALRQVPTQAFNVTNLRAFQSATLTAMLHREETQALWNTNAARLNLFPDGTGGVNPGDQRAIFYLIAALKPERILEVGTHIGASTSHLAVALKSSNVASPKQITTVDILDVNDVNVKRWENYGMPQSPLQVLEQLGVANQVEFKKSDAVEFLATADTKYDLIFLDGNHAGHAVYREVALALNCLTPNGVILLHDFFPNGEKLWTQTRAIEGPWLAFQRMKQEGAALDVLPLGDLPWPTKFDTNRTSLALLTAV